MAKLIGLNAVRAVALGAAVGLAGCSGFNGVEEAQYGVTYSHPISVETDVATLNVGVVAGQPGVAPSDRAAIEGFAAAYRQRGHGPLTISTPSGSPNAGAATVALSDVRDILSENGIGTGSLAYTPYRASGADANAPVILSFKRYVAKATACGDWSQDYALDPANGLMPNHGCATQNNLAAMVADPADLIGPRDMTPADADRRNTVLEKYREGEATATVRSDQDSGAVSEVE
ncbi:CpaD family pilus assembly protein [Parvibaculum sp.]|mgnify:FL=1|uniref:CpaD family pilus assembly protein n=1 Tax=Parvibaculum sp. TaxID=2024848 RepID=UPI002FD8A3A4